MCSLGLQPETCKGQALAKQIDLNMSSAKVFQIYYFSLMRLFEPKLLQLLLKKAVSSVQAAQCLPKYPGVCSG